MLTAVFNIDLYVFIGIVAVLGVALILCILACSVHSIKSNRDRHTERDAVQRQSAVDKRLHRITEVDTTYKNQLNDDVYTQLKYVRNCSIYACIVPLVQFGLLPFSSQLLAIVHPADWYGLITAVPDILYYINAVCLGALLMCAATCQYCMRSSNIGGSMLEVQLLAVLSCKLYLASGYFGYQAFDQSFGTAYCITHSDSVPSQNAAFLVLLCIVGESVLMLFIVAGLVTACALNAPTIRNDEQLEQLGQKSQDATLIG